MKSRSRPEWRLPGKRPRDFLAYGVPATLPGIQPGGRCRFLLFQLTSPAPQQPALGNNPDPQPDIGRTAAAGTLQCCPQVWRRFQRRERSDKWAHNAADSAVAIIAQGASVIARRNATSNAAPAIRFGSSSPTRSALPERGSQRYSRRISAATAKRIRSTSRPDKMSSAKKI